MSQDNQKKRKMEMTNSSRGLWLVKVPNYVAQMWQKAPPDMQVASLAMEMSADSQNPAKVRLILSKELLKMDPSKKLNREHEVKLSNTMKDSRITGIFSTSEHTDETALEGWVTHKMECQPIYNNEYLKMKKELVRAVKPLRSAEPINNIVNNYKPVSDHIHNKEGAKSKKEAAAKALSKDTIQDLLFQAFEKHQFYYLKDLQFITKQSPFVLKTVLKDIGDYSKDPAHKQMWELKAEYRHYQGKSAEAKK